MATDNSSKIDHSMTIVGEIQCAEHVILEGKVDGVFSGNSLTVAKGAQIHGNIVAREVECFGLVKGNVVTEKFTVRKSGCHEGTVETKELEVDPGAILDCALQSGSLESLSSAVSNHEPLHSPVKDIDLTGLLTAFDEGRTPSVTDVPWSERKELLDQVVSLLGRGKQLIKITGEKGCGKTIFIEKLKESLPPDIIVHTISTPVGSVRDLLGEIGLGLGAELQNDMVQNDIIFEIAKVLNEHRGEGKKVVLALDNADTMYPATLEGVIHNLTNAHGEGDEMLQVVFIGTDAVEGKLVQTTLEYFEDETNCLLNLDPLTIKDTSEYLRFCLQMEYDGDPDVVLSIFPYETIKRIHSKSSGNISEINLLAKNGVKNAHKAGKSKVVPQFIGGF